MKILLKCTGLFLCLTGLLSVAPRVEANGSPPPPKSEAKSKAIQFFENTEISGTVDAIYNYNFNRPPKADTNGNGLGDTSTNLLRAFDTDPNSFSLNLIELALQNKINDWALFRFDLDFGRDPRVFQAFGFNDGDNFELQQGYLYLTAPIGNGLNFKIGKFVTLHGAEVIESAGNNNTSRSLLFTWAIPFTHTGVLADYTFNDYWAINLGVLNGWDNVLDNNNGKTLHGAVTINPIPKKLSLWLGGTVGPEQDNSDGNFRTLFDSGLIWTALENLTFTLNFDLGRERGIGGTGFAHWWGGAAYAHWRTTDLFGLTLRGEYFAEDTPGAVGVRTGTAASKMGEVTLTSHLYLTDGLDLRFEFRHDHAANAIFAKSSGAIKTFQDTASAEVVYSF